MTASAMGLRMVELRSPLDRTWPIVTAVHLVSSVPVGGMEIQGHDPTSARPCRPGDVQLGMFESLKPAIGDRHPHDGPNIIPRRDGQRLFGKHLRKLQEERIVPQLGTVPRGG